MANDKNNLANLTTVTSRLSRRLDEHERAMGLTPTKDEASIRAKDESDQMVFASEEILLASTSIKKTLVEIRAGVADPLDFVEAAELYVAAVRSFAQAVKGSRKGGALQLMREAIESLDRLQGRVAPVPEPATAAP
jgi:hypothetical protein